MKIKEGHGRPIPHGRYVVVEAVEILKPWKGERAEKASGAPTES